MAIAAGIGYAVPQLVWIVWFSVNRTQVLRVIRPKWRLRIILDSCINGSSEKVSTLVFSVGIGCSDGVTSLSIIWYAQGLFGRLSGDISTAFRRRSATILDGTTSGDSPGCSGSVW